jgi:glyoxylase-like metal-dependent hydrolase (beta-lactamase superfamily II)
MVESENDQRLRQTKVSAAIIVFYGHYGNLKDYSGGNVTSTVVHSKNEAFVFDSLLYLEDTRKLLAAISKDLNLKVSGLINTHWHIDHTAGNQFFLETGRIISHSLCPDLMRADNLDWLNKDRKEEDKVRPSYPNESIGDGFSLDLGGKSKIEILHTPGHTPDSIIGWLRDEDVIIAADTVMELPFIGYGDSRALIKSLKKIQSMAGKKTQIIEGHGGICTSERLAGDISYIENLRKRVSEYVSSGKTIDKAEEEIELEDCITKERFENLTARFGAILWCHPENVKRIYNEYVAGEAK